ncbi:MAG TPA: hypothetical protein PLZ57_05445 [Pseudobdellovibrionaceae bacterium]|nr:hypothetical protein [Pseudobdellovibrionaceae bacterium]
MSPKKNPKLNWQELLLDNGSYKLVALFVTLILWITILGRRDFVLTREMDVEFLLPKSVILENTQGGPLTERKITVKVSGPRTALKRFGQSPGAVTVDLTKVQVQEGRPKSVMAPIQARNIELPFGVKLVSMSPDSLNLVLRPAPSPTPVASPSEVSVMEAPTPTPRPGRSKL